MRKLLHFLFVVSALALPVFVSAATLTLTASPAAFGVGDTVLVTVSVDSDTRVNTFSGMLNYPHSLTPVSVSDGNSVVNVWLTHPIIGTSSPIAFTGFTPGGYAGRGAALFSVVFKALAPGPAELALSSLELLRNDGAGTRESTAARPLSFSIGAKATGGFVAPADTVPPESFTPVEGSNLALFGGDSYLAFSAVDKGSGVARYEVAEARFPFLALSWHVATSPYRVSDQYLTSDIFVKAVDNAGNERVSVFHRAHFLRPYEWVILGILVGALCILYFYMRGRTRFSSR